MRPLIVGQITGVSQFAAVIAPAVLCRPHRWPSSNQATTLESQPIQGIQYVSGQTLSDLRSHLRDEVYRISIPVSGNSGGYIAVASEQVDRMIDVNVVISGVAYT